MKCAAMVLACFVQNYLPPHWFDHEPVKAYAIMYAPRHEMRLLCGFDTWGCVYPSKRLIVVCEALRGELLDIILRHEKAHLNGWRH